MRGPGEQVALLETVLDQAPAAIYVSALDSCELLYANCLAREIFVRRPDSRNSTCYYAAGYDTPCPFCQKDKLSRSEFFVREFTNADTGQVFRLRGKIIDWDGRAAHVEYIENLHDGDSRQLEKELTAANEKMQAIVNAIPGGVAVYKISDIVETVYFSDGVPELSGYTVEEYRELVKQDAIKMTYSEDTALVEEKIREVVRSRGTVSLEFRKRHRDGHIVWVRAQAKWIGEEENCPLLHCVFHNISDLKEARLEMDHLVNSIPGGIASYRVEDGRFIPTYYSDGVMALTGHTREEYDEIVGKNALDIIYELDLERVLNAAKKALVTGEVLDISYRMRNREGNLVWIHLNGRRMGPLSDSMRFYAVFTGMSAETRLFQSIADTTADSIYVIDKSNFDLLYINESKKGPVRDRNCVGQKCYTVLQGKTKPCSFCTLNSHEPDGVEHVMQVDGSKRFFQTRFKETDWNGIPAYVKYVRDVTEEVMTRKQKERLEQYFQTVLKYLPSGIAVVRYQKGGKMTTEFLSEGFAEMTGMSLDEAMELYQENAMKGVHPDDQARVQKEMDDYVRGGAGRCEIEYRLRAGKSGYIWVRNSLTMIHSEDGESRVYAVYHDLTKERREREEMREQYSDLILQHYRTPGPNALIVGHCNVTREFILDIIDYTDSDLLKQFGTVRDEFFAGMAGLLPDPGERQTFLENFLSEPLRRVFAEGKTEVLQECFVKLPHESQGRYVQVKVDMVAAPDNQDTIGILTVIDITQEMISRKILHQLSVTGYDFVIDLDLLKDRFTVLSCDEKASCLPPCQGKHSEWMESMIQTRIVPKDRMRYRNLLKTDYIIENLKEKESYTFSFSIIDDQGEIWAKNLTVVSIDLRLGRICLARTDITDSIREQQGLLRMVAHTFELAGFVNLGNGSLTMHTRETVLENLPAYFMEDYESSMDAFVEKHGAKEALGGVQDQFRLSTMVERLGERPDGYDFLFLYHSEEENRYKQITVLWGDENHRTICLVRADVTDMLAEERESKKQLENALALAREANRAKSDFLSSMSHDIRTPMNAIIGMTALATAHLGERERVEDYLKKISVSSRHLLSLINDVLDMSKIERSKITLGRMQINLSELMDQILAMMAPQAREAGLCLKTGMEGLRHKNFYGDSLRISQILINLLSNAVKFTPESGEVEFLVEEIAPAGGPNRVRYRFTVRDTGIGMPESFVAHLFEPFSRSRAADRIEGTGLGLSITRGLVELMDGTISVESQEGKGSAFQVELEFEEAVDNAENGGFAAAAEPSGQSEGNDLTGFCFLVAEDNALNAEILCELLSMSGAQTVLVTDGAQAVETFRRAKPGTYDAVLMDIQMPEMNGYEATRMIRETDRPDAAAVPVIAMTANAFAEDIQTALEAGMTAHVAKPIDVNVLWATLKKVLGQPEQPGGGETGKNG